MQTSAIPSSLRPSLISTVSCPILSRVKASLWSELSFLRKVTYILTKPEGLNLGRQIGIHEAEAGELKTEGECIVFIMICISKGGDTHERKISRYKRQTEWMNGMLPRSDQGDHTAVCNKHHIQHILYLNIRL